MQLATSSSTWEDSSTLRNTSSSLRILRWAPPPAGVSERTDRSAGVQKQLNALSSMSACSEKLAGGADVEVGDGKGMSIMSSPAREAQTHMLCGEGTAASEGVWESVGGG